MATQIAVIKRERDNRLAIHLRYVDRDSEQSTRWISPGEHHFGVPYETWAAHAGQTIDLSTWEGTGEGMIGGPTRTDVAAWIYDGILETPMYAASSSEVRAAIEDLETFRDDERYDICLEVRQDIEQLLANGYRWLEANSEPREP